MKKIVWHYILLACIMHSPWIHSSKEPQTSKNILTIKYSTGKEINILEKAHTWSSFTRALLRKTLEEKLNDLLADTKVEITASGENVALALDFACKNPSKISKLTLQNPEINVAGINPIDYYWGNFPLYAIDNFPLSVRIEYYDDEVHSHWAEALHKLCSQRTDLKCRLIPSKNCDENCRSKQIAVDRNNKPSPNLGSIIAQENKSWWYNKILLTTFSGLILYVFYRKVYPR